MIDRFGELGFRGQRDAGSVLKTFGVTGCIFPTGPVPALQPFQLDAEHRSLDRIETAVVAFEVVKIFLRLPVIPDHAHLLRHLFVLRHDGPGFAEGSEVLAGIEAETASRAQRAGLPVFIGGAVGLAGVFDDDKLVLPGDLEDRVHVGRLAVEVDGD